MRFTSRVDRVGPSATMEISSRASALTEAGTDVVDLSVGEPDFETPAAIVSAGKAALDAGHTTYTTPAGIEPLRSAIADRLTDDELAYESEQIVVTPGAKQALYETVQVLVDDGDEVVLFDPAWVSYAPIVKLAGGRLSRLDLSVYDFQLEPALGDLAKVITDDTSLMILNSPANPTGAVFSTAALEGVRDLAVEHDVTVVSDEIYGDITYDVEPTSIGALDGMFERTVTVSGFSKSYAMTGWRLGYMAGPDEFIRRASRINSHSASCATNFVQHAGVTALRECDQAVADMVAAFEDRRNALVDQLSNHGVDVSRPDGAFYVMLPVDPDDETWAERALTQAHVATVPGTAFGAPGYVRLSYATAQERVRTGIERLVAADLL